MTGFVCCCALPRSGQTATPPSPARQSRRLSITSSAIASKVGDTSSPRVCSFEIKAKPAYRDRGCKETASHDGAGRNVSSWPIATGDALTTNRRRFRGIADMKRFSAPDDL
jgi:hypothetical protein